MILGRVGAGIKNHFLLPSLYENEYPSIVIINNLMSLFICTVLANSVKTVFSQVGLA